VQVGDVIAERYELEEVLGVGGMASVFRARDRVLERKVALKILAERYSSDPQYVERFRREAQAIARLSHPNIVTVIDRGNVDGCQYIVFEHVRGSNLKQLLRERRRFPVSQALALAHQAARGLAFAHEHGIVHRDVKPQNVLVDDDGDAKVTDFGIARSAALDDGLTDSGVVLGTSHYIAPEQATGGRVDERSDQYSLGALLFEPRAWSRLRCGTFRTPCRACASAGPTSLRGWMRSCSGRWRSGRKTGSRPWTRS
jgi:serine/threonine protein kinase